MCTPKRNLNKRSFSAHEWQKQLSLSDSPCEELETSPGQQNALQPHDARVREKTPRQQRHQAAHALGNGYRVREEVRHTQWDQSGHTCVEAPHHHPEHEHFPARAKKQDAASLVVVYMGPPVSFNWRLFGKSKGLAAVQNVLKTYAKQRTAGISSSARSLCRM